MLFQKLVIPCSNVESMTPPYDTGKGFVTSQSKREVTLCDFQGSIIKSDTVSSIFSLSEDVCAWKPAIVV